MPNKLSKHKQFFFALAMVSSQIGSAVASLTYEDFYNLEQNKLPDDIKIISGGNHSPINYGGDRGAKQPNSGCRILFCMADKKGPMNQKECRHDVRAMHYQLLTDPLKIISPIRHASVVPACLKQGTDSNGKSGAINSADSIDTNGNPTGEYFNNERVTVYRHDELTNKDIEIYRAIRSNVYYPDNDGITKNTPQQRWSEESSKSRKVESKCVYTDAYLKHLGLGSSTYAKYQQYISGYFYGYKRNDENNDHQRNDEKILFARFSSLDTDQKTFQNNIKRNSNLKKSSYDVFTGEELFACLSSKLIKPKPSPSQQMNTENDEDSLIINDPATNKLDPFSKHNYSKTDPTEYDKAVLNAAPIPKSKTYPSASYIKSDDPELSYFQKGDKVVVTVIPVNNGDLSKYGQPASAYEVTNKKIKGVAYEPISPELQKKIQAHLNKAYPGSTLQMNPDGTYKGLHYKVSSKPDPVQSADQQSKQQKIRLSKEPMSDELAKKVQAQLDKDDPGAHLKKDADGSYEIIHDQADNTSNGNGNNSTQSTNNSAMPNIDVMSTYQNQGQ